jgi:hypothetical protein
MAENAKDSDERDLRGGRCCAPVRLVDQERRAELDRQGNGLGFTGVQFLGILGYAIGVQGSPNLEERQSGDTNAFEWPARLGPLARHYAREMQGREMQGRNEDATEDPVQQMRRSEKGSA